MEMLKELYYDFNDSKGCAALGELPEVKEAYKKLKKWTKYFDTYSDFLEIEDVFCNYGAAHEMQGFVYGFRYAMRLAAETFVK